MKREEVENLEKVTGQLEGLHRELSLLAKKSSNDALNLFKLRMLNSALAAANDILAAAYKPIDGFNLFDSDEVTSNSDATVVLAAYLEELERFRADNITYGSGSWRYTLDDGGFIQTKIPKRLRIK